MKTKVPPLLFLLVFMLFDVSAQEIKKKWTLQECVNVAIENNLRVKRGIYNVENYHIGTLQNGMAFLPSANASASYGQNYGRALNPVSNSYINRNSNTINVQGSLSLPLFNGLRLQNSFRQSLRDYEASNEDLNKVKNDVILSIVTYYINVIFSKELYETSRFQLNSSQQQVDRIRKQVDAGAVPITNLLNQEAQVATNEVNMINQENALNLAILQLKQAMQVPASTPMEIDIPEIPIGDLVISSTPEQIYEIAVNTMPEIKSANLKVKSAEYNFKANRGNLYPRLSFNASAASNYSSVSDVARYAPDGSVTLSPTPIGQVNSTTPVYGYVSGMQLVSPNYSERDQLKDNLFKSLSLQLTIPIFNGLQSRLGVRRSFVSKELAEITVTETQNTLRQSIETAYNDAISSSKAYSASLKQVSAREEAYRMTKQRFENGAANFADYNIAENDLYQAKSDLTRAKYNFIFKKKILDFYQGIQIEY